MTPRVRSSASGASTTIATLKVSSRNSSDGGRSWRAARLGEDLGRYSFREWTIPFKPDAKGKHVLMARAINRIGESQPFEPLWNPAGYLRNVVEPVNVEAV